MNFRIKLFEKDHFHNLIVAGIRPAGSVSNRIKKGGGGILPRISLKIREVNLYDFDEYMYFNFHNLKNR